ncbi:MAG: nucleoside/nucleotide kinase family protein, partial [Planctomycetota bacterium]
MSPPPSPTPAHPDTESLARELIGWLGAAPADASGARRLVGLTGAPGSGKSTLAARLAEAVNRRAGHAICAVLPMDGFHLPNAELSSRGLAPVKGSPPTFDAPAFVDKLAEVRRGGACTVPVYSRELHEPVADAVTLAPSVALVIVEGNYLLLNEGP